MAQTRSAADETGSDRQPSQFDYLLAAIPLALLAGVGSVMLFPIPQFIGISLGAAVATCFVGYGVYTIAQSTPTNAEASAGSRTVLPKK